MVSNGQLTLRAAGAYLGQREGPPNRSGDPIVDECQAMYGMSGEPWCAMFAGYCIATSKADAKYKAAAKSIVSPSTAIMYDAAAKKGWLTTGSARTKPGDLFIIRGLHVGFVLATGSAGTFTTIEGNHNNSVSSAVRSWRDGWAVIELPGVGSAGPQALVYGYGFDDARVKLYGGWPTPETRDRQMAKYAIAHPDHWVQAVRVVRESPFAFRAGPAGTYGSWTYGPWTGANAKENRDVAAKKYEAANKDANKIRTWRHNLREV